MHPSGRYGYHVAHHVSKAGGGAQPDEQMHKVRDTTDCLGHAIHIPHHSTKIGMQPSPYAPVRKQGR